MSRIKTIYSNQVLYAGPSPATGAQASGDIKKINNLQSLGNSFTYSLEDINIYGSLAAKERVNLEGADVSLDFSYYLTDFQNEVNLGFAVGSDINAISYFLTKTQEDRNYYRYVAPEGYDAVGLANSSGAVMGIGNGFLSSYGLALQVGDFPTATVGVSALNANAVLDGVAQETPAVDPQTGRQLSGTFTLESPISDNPAGKPTIIKPGDVVVEFSNDDAGAFQALGDLIVQNVSLDFDLNLEPIRKLGSRLPVSRDLTPPIQVNVGVEALMADLVENNLVDFLCDEPATDITVSLYDNSCDAGGPTQDPEDIFAKIIIKNAKLTSQDLSGTIGPNDTVSLQFQSQIGGPNDTENGLFMSGVTGYAGGSGISST